MVAASNEPIITGVGERKGSSGLLYGIYEEMKPEHLFCISKHTVCKNKFLFVLLLSDTVVGAVAHSVLLSLKKLFYYWCAFGSVTNKSIIALR